MPPTGTVLLSPRRKGALRNGNVYLFICSFVCLFVCLSPVLPILPSGMPGLPRVSHIILIIMISKTMFMVLSSWQSHCESSPGSFDECRTAPSGRLSKTKPDDLGCESACTGCQNLHPPSPFIIITQPES